MSEHDIAVVGAVPAGLAAAGEAAALGCRVIVIDDNPRPGGQYLRQAIPSQANSVASR